MMIKPILNKVLSASIFCALAMGTQVAQADAIDDIKKAGVLKVAVKADYKPYGFRDPSGKIIGIITARFALSCRAKYQPLPDQLTLVSNPEQCRMGLR